MTYFEELAQMGSLYEFLNGYMVEEFRGDETFRREMLTVMIDHPGNGSNEVQIELLRDLYNSLSMFNNRVEECKHQH